MVTSNQGVRAGKKIALKVTVDEAVKKCESVKNVFVMKRTEAAMNLGPKDIDLSKVFHIIKNTIFDLHIEIYMHLYRK